MSHTMKFPFHFTLILFTLSLRATGKILLACSIFTCNDQKLACWYLSLMYCVKHFYFSLLRTFHLIDGNCTALLQFCCTKYSITYLLEALHPGFFHPWWNWDDTIPTSLTRDFCLSSMAFILSTSTSGPAPLRAKYNL